MELLQLLDLAQQGCEQLFEAQHNALGITQAV